MPALFFLIDPSVTHPLNHLFGLVCAIRTTPSTHAVSIKLLFFIIKNNGNLKENLWTYERILKLNLRFFFYKQSNQVIIFLLII